DFANTKDLSARQLVKRSGVKFWQIPRLVRFFRKESAKRADSIKPFEGVGKMIECISKVCDLGILSTNSTETVNKFLVNNQLDNYFGFIKTDVPLFGKKRALRRVKRRLLKSYAHLLYIGDEIRDIEACQKAGVDIISVSWGFNSRSALIEHNKNVADNTEQLSDMILQTI
ncbi:MAG: HAD-IA family hydrolase, partial [Bacteroidales bacterium]|nr:HAD-IA family hydrolase [Bacteroidales bacterium]